MKRLWRITFGVLATLSLLLSIALFGGLIQSHYRGHRVTFSNHPFDPFSLILWMLAAYPRMKLKYASPAPADHAWPVSDRMFDLLAIAVALALFIFIGSLGVRGMLPGTKSRE